MSNTGHFDEGEGEGIFEEVVGGMGEDAFFDFGVFAIFSCEGDGYRRFTVGGGGRFETCR